MVRNGLIRIRKAFNQDQKRFFLVMGVVAALSVVISFVLDAFTPFGGVAMIGRSLLLIPLSGSIFSIGYAVSLILHRARIREDEAWVPFRLRFSPTWRRRIALIVGAFLVVIMYASGFRVGYTLTAGITLAIGIALLAFIRTTRAEAAREAMDIPDRRDVRIDHYVANREKIREEKKAARKRKKEDEAEELFQE